MANTERKKRASKVPVRIIALITALLIPFIAAALMIFAAPPVYGETFLGELAPKFERLTSIEQPKIVVIGGSSVAFGLDSASLEEYTGMPVVNFGLYATLGTKVMLDLSLSGLGKGDIVVVAPELDEQTLSLYFNAEAAWQALESDYSMLKYVGSDNYSDLAGGAIKYCSDKTGYILSGKRPFPTGVYRRDSFNEYGDISYPRRKNVMTIGFDPNRRISLTPDIFSGEFITYLNEYIAKAEKKGATVYFDFCPLNRSALSSDTTDDSLFEFYSFIRKNIKCRIIGSLKTSIMNEEYFYDTNFHLNDKGVKLHTAHMAENLLRVAGDMKMLEVLAPTGMPEGPGDTPVTTAPSTENYEKDPWEDYFTYMSYGKVLAINGVTAEGLKLSKLEIPRTSKGTDVLVLASGALSSCKNLKELTIYENLSLLEDGCLSGCTSLEIIHMRREDAEGLEAGEKLFENTSPDLKVYLYTDTSFFNFSSGYWWSVHSSRLKLVTN